VMDLLRRVAVDHAAAVLVVTHDEKIFGGFNRLVRLRDGRIMIPVPGGGEGYNAPFAIMR
jgi:ABC-type lipoprotein export system ATPase subunit